MGWRDAKPMEAMPQTLPPVSNRPRRIGIATAFMCALAGGALWCLVSLRVAGNLAPFAFVVALAVVWTLRAHGYGGTWTGRLTAPLFVAFAAVYAFYLQAVARVAGMLGVSIREAFTKMQGGFALDVARANLDARSLAIVVVALVVAALAMWPRGYVARR